MANSNMHQTRKGSGWLPCMCERCAMDVCDVASPYLIASTDACVNSAAFACHKTFTNN